MIFCFKNINAVKLKRIQPDKDTTSEINTNIFSGNPLTGCEVIFLPVAWVAGYFIHFSGPQPDFWLLRARNGQRRQ